MAIPHTRYCSSMLYWCALLLVMPAVWAQTSPQPLQAVFDYLPPQEPTTSRLLEENARYRKYLVQFPSALVTPYSNDRVVSAMFYTPQDRTTYPVVLILPHLSGSMTAERFLARGLVRAGFAVLHITEPYYFTFEKRHESWLQSAKDLDDLVQVVHLLRQAVINTRQGIDWVLQQPGVEQGHIGLMGVSMGGWVGVLVSGIDERITSSVYVLAGGDISALILQSPLTVTLRDNLRQHGVLPEDIQVVSNTIDPLNLAPAARRNHTLMINAVFDRTVPRSCTDRLWEALGRPPLFWIPVGHQGANFFRWYIRQKAIQHFGRTLQ